MSSYPWWFSLYVFQPKSYMHFSFLPCASHMGHPYHPPLFSKPNNTKMVIIHDIYFKKYFIATYGIFEKNYSPFVNLHTLRLILGKLRIYINKN